MSTISASTASTEAGCSPCHDKDTRVKEYAGNGWDGFVSEHYVLRAHCVPRAACRVPRAACRVPRAAYCVRCSMCYMRANTTSRTRHFHSIQ